MRKKGGKNMDEELLCPVCGYTGVASDCPFCHVPMESIKIPDETFERKTYPEELLNKAGADPINDDNNENF
ncbi:MAG: hypothetical protein COX39_00120 [Candidatus Nealsonbacteria bacterium CG23_combo_of_CG06-09_8_20_14_all_40_13]|uniref:Uncharacterized protein n=1 Tax=Candidatus Nealsonbacteria bacterium CG23_combo_of_CG06-09_8_20_14_all_40_13 TaxID=1974724 RepID=A0A2G9YRU0_9BACT|nr:MAG: hypothetical protein COX39_00120 [Candidatus Nealsonbacteria bacterium CG23_combo_of_CG06-09_8_20_14_all_40_13]PIR70937.1 MAG: hypothetical protein COU44_02305 [Candidatus Nealsonbacteria bacterium CG10_big_fil_rev_8_21_14_0_10_40_24]